MENNNQEQVQQAKKSVIREPWVRNLLVIFAAILVIGAAAFLIVSNKRISIDNSMVSAPQIDLAPTAPGPLNAVYVNVGDDVPANTVVAEVGTELIKTQVAGEIISVQKDIGKLFNAGQPVVSMIDPTQLRVVGQIDENKGLSDVHVGQQATFTVDAFGSKVYHGVVDEVSPTSNSQSAVFSISDQRPTQTFDVKIRYDITAYPELKNGMSAKVTIYK
ncbi:HlyD family efflux transporter periplasmic adaptor subunit [Patescibacteria group bacterium]|nr:HlyD family efflux transporter periplasmic adaptor subunit [Patescibacteria group bacterium]